MYMETEMKIYIEFSKSDIQVALAYLSSEKGIIISDPAKIKFKTVESSKNEFGTEVTAWFND